MSEEVSGQQMARQQSIELEDIEYQIYTRQYEKAAQTVLKLLERMDANKGGFAVPCAATMTPRERDYRQLQSLSRLAGSITAMLADPGTQLSKKGFEAFMSLKRFITSVFMASGFGNSNHLIGLVGQRDSDGKTSFTDDYMLRKFLLVTGPSASLEEIDVASVIPKLPPEMAIPFWLGFVDQEIVLGRREAEHRQHVSMLYEQLPDKYVVPPQLLVRVINAWMFLSYMDFREKHQPKKYLNRLLRRWGESKGIKPPLLASQDMAPGEKPRLVVCLEAFNSNHAMHRCYRKSIESLREHFHVVALTLETTIDNSACEAFDEVDLIKPGENIRKIAGRLIKQKPAVIYYPSLGMREWTTVLAQFRFAPLQCMSLGHPATSMSPEIDYAFTGPADPELFSEKIVTGLSGFDHSPYPADIDFTRQRQDTDRVRIAVNAKSYKINYQLIEACSEIRARTEKPVDFIFFPNCQGITYEAFRQEMDRYLDAVVYPGTDYKTYIDRLRACDLVLNPFPFGNTNGINDCAQIGLPFVCMDGDEPHSHVDVMMSEELGYPAFCRATTVDEYIEAAVRLADNESLREGIIRDMVQSNAADRIIGERPGKQMFGDAVWKLWYHHDRLQLLEERVIDIRKLDAPLVSEA